MVRVPVGDQGANGEPAQPLDHAYPPLKHGSSEAAYAPNSKPFGGARSTGHHCWPCRSARYARRLERRSRHRPTGIGQAGSSWRRRFSATREHNEHGSGHRGRSSRWDARRRCLGRSQGHDPRRVREPWSLRELHRQGMGPGNFSGSPEHQRRARPHEPPSHRGNDGACAQALAKRKREQVPENPAASGGVLALRLRQETVTGMV